MRGTDPDKEDQFLSLSAAARLLGVHPSTVRVWADLGHIPVYRTQGGHRRFRRSEVQLLKQTRMDVDPLPAEYVLQRVLAAIRKQMSEADLQTQSWYTKLDPAAREHCRQIGQALSEGLAIYLVQETPRADAQACAIGQDYAVQGQRGGLGRLEAVQAFLFFRQALRDALLLTYEDAQVTSSLAWGEMLRKMGRYTDQVLVALVEGYENP